MKLYVISDLHLESGDFQVPLVEPDAVVVAGDLHVGTQGLAWAADRLPNVPILYVLGNHEYYHRSMPDLLREMRSEASRVDARITILDRAAAELDDVVFLGTTLWTDFELGDDVEEGMSQAWQALTDFWVIHVGEPPRRLEPRDVLAVHQRERYWLETSLERYRDKKVVVITHHPPSASSVPAFAMSDPWRSVYASNLDDLVRTSGAALWIHGHIHTPADYLIGRTRVLSNPRGYVRHGVHGGFRPGLIVDV